MKGMVYDGHYYFYLVLQFFSAITITQPTPISTCMLLDDEGYKSLHVVYCKTSFAT